MNITSEYHVGWGVLSISQLGENAPWRYPWSPAGKLHLAGSTENSQLAGRKGTDFKKITFLLTLQNYVFFPSRHISCHFRQVLKNHPLDAPDYSTKRWVLRSALKRSTVLAVRMFFGSWFHAFAATTRKVRSLYVTSSVPGTSRNSGSCRRPSRLGL